MLWKARLVFSRQIEGDKVPDFFEEQTWIYAAQDWDEAALHASKLLQREAEEYVNVEKNLVKWVPVAYYRLEHLGSLEECLDGIEVESRFLDELPEECQ